MKIKLNKNGNIEHFKIQIVACGFVQRKGVNYEETFTPVANLKSIGIICALAAKYDLKLDQMDVSTAYLNGVLNKEIYISPPEGAPSKMVSAGNSKSQFMALNKLAALGVVPLTLL